MANEDRNHIARAVARQGPTVMAGEVQSPIVMVGEGPPAAARAGTTPETYP